MEIVKKTDKYTIFKKKTGRYSVKDDSKKYMNGEEKIKILLEEGLIKISPKKVKEEAPAEDTKAEDTKAEAPAEEVKEEAPAEEVKKDS